MFRLPFESTFINTHGCRHSKSNTEEGDVLGYMVVHDFFDKGDRTDVDEEDIGHLFH